MNDIYVLAIYDCEITLVGTLAELCIGIKEICDDHGESVLENGDHTFINVAEPTKDLFIWDYIETFYKPKDNA